MLGRGGGVCSWGWLWGGGECCVEDQWGDGCLGWYLGVDNQETVSRSRDTSARKSSISLGWDWLTPATAGEAAAMTLSPTAASSSSVQRTLRSYIRWWGAAGGRVRGEVYPRQHRVWALAAAAFTVVVVCVCGGDPSVLWNWTTVGGAAVGGQRYVQWAAAWVCRKACYQEHRKWCCELVLWIRERVRKPGTRFCFLDRYGGDSKLSFYLGKP